MWSRTTTTTLALLLALASLSFAGKPFGINRGGGAAGLGIVGFGDAGGVADQHFTDASLSRKDCFCKLVKVTSTIEDSGCTFETVDDMVAQVWTPLQNLLHVPFFRYHYINFDKKCPFWREEEKCNNRACAVETEDEVPEFAIWQEKNLGDLDHTSHEKMESLLSGCGDDVDFCVLDDERHHTDGGVYVDLIKNPERFTGYGGVSSARIWKAIYEENCFKSSTASPFSEEEDQCLEKRAFYRIVSGLHASIAAHLAYDYLDRGTGKWGPNFPLFHERLGIFPKRIRNIYFAWMVIHRAVTKLGSSLLRYPYCSEFSDMYKETTVAVQELVSVTGSCPSTFDEHSMFAGDAMAMKEEFREHFKNITRIMECVGCERCRLWGKIQTQGIGTALKVLFTLDDIPGEDAASKLSRGELLTLMNVYGRFTESLVAVEKYREWHRQYHVVQDSEETPSPARKPPTTVLSPVSPSTPLSAPPVVDVPAGTSANENDSSASASPAAMESAMEGVVFEPPAVAPVKAETAAPVNDEL